jgi:HEAT repeat protein
MMLRITRVTLAAVPLALAGCGSPINPDGSQVAWETKSQSVLGREEQTMPLTAPSLFEAQGGPRLRAVSIDLLVQAAGADDPLVRANAIEMLALAPEAAVDVLPAALQDENRGVRFVAAMTVGELRAEPLVPAVSQMLFDESDSVRAAAIFAMRRCGEPVDPSPLAFMIVSQDPEVRANAAVILGKLGDRSALPMLREALNLPMTGVALARTRIVELQIAEAMVKLGDTGQMEVIRAALFAPDEHGELKVLACQLCGRLRDRPYAGALVDKAMRRGIDQEAPEVRLASLQALAEMEPTRAPIDLPMDYLANQRWDLRAQAATTMGYIRDPAVLPALSAVLNDGNPVVQVAAAGAILRVTVP